MANAEYDALQAAPRRIASTRWNEETDDYEDVEDTGL